MKPVIAIIGRPNVGKSTLFNRLAGGGKAIVIDEPGATRDRNYTDCTWNNRPFTLIDTGGFEPAAEVEILVQMREQTKLAIEEADIILFMMDARDGLTPSDQEIARMLRVVKKTVFYTVNKVDGPRHEALVSEFYRLGIEKLYPISAQHGPGLDDLMDDVADCLPEAEPVKDGEGDRIRIAVIGRPNVGKSSLINRILGYERTIVNPVPGTTRDAIDTPITRDGKHYLLIDTAGIRRKSRISLTMEKYSIVQALKAIDRADIALILLDAEEGISEQDVKIAGLAMEKGTACILVVNKWDLVEKDNSTIGTYVEDIRYNSKFLEFAPIIFVSALSGQRVTKIFALIERVYAQYTRRVETGELNRKIREIIEANPPPGRQNRPNIFNYITQVAIKPPSFVLFVRDPDHIHFSYERYLVNRIREAFGFAEVPIRLFFRKKTS
ncbi:MAG: ribosome biogenesis GTPase Der [Syntrophobacterales bacterium GWC2_56_13]|nr:MAG: ribosome biogenesis GTPase Der [Syntrophobacterales bacterium GWC2_56_13]